MPGGNRHATADQFLGQNIGETVGSLVGAADRPKLPAQGAPATNAEPASTSQASISSTPQNGAAGPEAMPPR